MSSPSPFFIVGCGRSGTSLLRSFLNGHSQVAIPTESLFIVDYLRAADRFDTTFLINMLVREPEIREWGLSIQPDDFSGYSTIIDAIRSLHERYAHEQGMKLWGQKTPRFVRHLDLIIGAFPDAVVIHLVRDPRAVVSSLMRSDVHRSTAYHAARRWQMDVSAGLAYEAVHPEKVLRVTYEDLVLQPQENLEAITDFIGIAFEPKMLEKRAGTEEYSAFYDNIHSNLDQEVTNRHIQKWVEHLKPEEVRFVESMSLELMGRLGYRTMMDLADSMTVGAWRQILSRLSGLPLQFLKYLSQRPEYLGYLVYRKWKLGLLKEFLWNVHY
jgi:hypothetical protein